MQCHGEKEEPVKPLERKGIMATQQFDKLYKIEYEARLALSRSCVSPITGDHRLETMEKQSDHLGDSNCGLTRRSCKQKMKKAD